MTAGSGDPGGGSMARVSPVAVRETVFSAEICSVDFPAAQHPGTILFDDIGNIKLHHRSTYLQCVYVGVISSAVLYKIVRLTGSLLKM